MDDAVALVTGAARGMGRACAARFAPDVNVLVIVDRNETGLVDVAGELSGAGAKVVPMALDVTDGPALADLTAQLGGLGRLQAVAHAAGISMSMADWRQVLHVDLVGTALLIEALTPLATDGTAMVCFASIAAQMATFGDAAAIDPVLDDPLHPELLDRARQAAGPVLEDAAVAYGWAKRGVQRLTRRTAVRWSRCGARICSVSPGIIDTPLARLEAESGRVAELVAKTPIPRYGNPEEVAEVVAFLCSARASFVNGCDLLVDGGLAAAIEAT
jgi:NAD(P)-dependent dehydrogenase (short-subunit alcohol dehydrogenase family)